MKKLWDDQQIRAGIIIVVFSVIMIPAHWLVLHDNPDGRVMFSQFCAPLYIFCIIVGCIGLIRNLHDKRDLIRREQTEHRKTKNMTNSKP